jgi:hypothetical protein
MRLGICFRGEGLVERGHLVGLLDELVEVVDDGALGLLALI